MEEIPAAEGGTPSWENHSSKVGFTVIFKWQKFHQRSGELGGTTTVRCKNIILFNYWSKTHGIKSKYSGIVDVLHYFMGVRNHLITLYLVIMCRDWAGGGAFSYPSPGNASRVRMYSLRKPWKRALSGIFRGSSNGRSCNPYCHDRNNTLLLWEI